MREDRLVTLPIDRPERHAFRLAFGQNLKSQRAAAGLSQETLAARCFLRTDHISDFERGGAPPRLELLLLLADALGVTLGELADGLVAPTRARSLARLLAVITEHPDNSTDALAKTSELPESYVVLLLRYLQSYGQIHSAVTGWRQGVGDGNRLGHG